MVSECVYGGFVSFEVDCCDVCDGVFGNFVDCKMGVDEVN